MNEESRKKRNLKRQAKYKNDIIYRKKRDKLTYEYTKMNRRYKQNVYIIGQYMEFKDKTIKRLNKIKKSNGLTWYGFKDIET